MNIITTTISALALNALCAQSAIAALGETDLETFEQKILREQRIKEHKRQLFCLKADSDALNDLSYRMVTLAKAIEANYKWTPNQDAPNKKLTISKIFTESEFQSSDFAEALHNSVALYYEALDTIFEEEEIYQKKCLLPLTEKFNEKMSRYLTWIDMYYAQGRAPYTPIQNTEAKPLNNLGNPMLEQ